MTSQADKADRFLALHRPGEPLLMPNPWDVGSARLLASLGFEALATTSSGFAATLGRLDYGVTRDEAIGHGRALSEAVAVPVSADLEDCFGREPAGVAETILLAIDAGLAGGSVEDYTGDPADPIYDAGLATERVAAAAEAAHGGGRHFALTARAENFVRGITDLDDTIRRLQAFAQAGADVLFAPGLSAVEDVRRVVESVDRPVSMLVRPTLTVADLADAGVARVSVGGSFAYVGLGAVVEAARELREQGTTGFFDLARAGGKAARDAFDAGR